MSTLGNDRTVLSRMQSVVGGPNKSDLALDVFAWAGPGSLSHTIWHALHVRNYCGMQTFSPYESIVIALVSVLSVEDTSDEP